MAVDMQGTRRPQTRMAPADRRHQIIEQATRLISASGFNAVSLADIADACGIRKSSVQHHFPTMNGLLAAVLTQRDTDSYDGEAYPEELRHPLEVRAYLDRVVEHNVARRQLVGLYVALGTEAIDPQHPAHDYFASRNRLALRALEKMLPWKPDPGLAAQELLSFWQGLEGLWIAEAVPDFLAVWHLFCDRFFE